MAKIEDILKLKEAGFTADEMAKLLPLVQSEPEIKIEQPKIEEPKVNSDAVLDSRFAGIEDKFNKVIERLEANALLNDKQPTDKFATTMEDIMAKIIEPKE